MAGVVYDLQEAREIARAALELVESDAVLDEADWGGWLGGFETFMECESEETCCKVERLRYGLEEVAGLNEPADLCVAALKLSLSAFVVVGANPYYPAGYAGISPRHSDVDTLVRKAAGLLEQAKRFDPAPFPITRNTSIVAKVQGHQQKTWLRNLVDSAVRPGDTDGADTWEPSQN